VFRQDYIERMIRQFADFIARIAGHNRAGLYDEALAEAARAWDELLPVPRALVDVTDTATLAALLEKPATMRLAAAILIEEGRATAGKGDPLHAGQLYRRATELTLEARAIDPTEEDDAIILELSREVHGQHLDPRYRAG
jgi:hypothetical protein